jgi:hypothetical protein
MNISPQFGSVCIFLTKGGFVPILKELSATFMPVIEIDSITGKESPHQSGD